MTFLIRRIFARVKKSRNVYVILLNLEGVYVIYYYFIVEVLFTMKDRNLKG